MTSLARLDEVIAVAARLRTAGVRVYVVATGAGSGIQDVLWRVPGASSFLVGAAFPYDAAATEELLGFRPEHFANEQTAIDLATAAYVHAVVPGDSRKRAIGLGLAASVATTREHRGEHRFHVAVVSASCALGRTVVLSKGAGPERRRLDGDLADEAALRALFDAAGVAREPALEDWTSEARARFFERPYWDELGARHTPASVPAGAALFPGAFDPPHEGHFALASSESPVVFTICATPPHKEALALGDMLARAKLLRGHRRLFTEGDPLYLDKARRFPGRTLILGADACERMLDPRWGTPPEPLLEELQSLGVRFRVSARMVDGVTVTPESIVAKLPERFRAMFVPIPGRWDISSTELRARAECA